MKINADLYVIVETDGRGNVVGYPKGGGSSAKSFIRAFESAESAQRSLRHLTGKTENTVVMRVEKFGEAF